MQHLANVSELRAQAGEAAIEVDNLSHTYAGADGSVPALIDISLTVRKGRFVVIVGPERLRQDLAADDAGWTAAARRRAPSSATAGRSRSPTPSASA